MAAFCPIMQYHSEFNQHREPCHDRTPWNIRARTGDQRVIPAFRHFVNTRHNLMPYIWQEAQHAARTGQPMMRALGLWHREASPYQYFFGRDLLVCPVVEEGASAWSAYLPGGDWFDLWTGERFAGGRQVTVPAPLDCIPVFVRAGAMSERYAAWLARAGAAIPVAWGASRQWGEYVPLSAEATDTLYYE